MGEKYNKWKLAQEEEEEQKFLEVIRDMQQGEASAVLDGADYLEADRASQITAAQLESDSRIRKCDDLIAENYREWQDAVREQDHVTRIAAERNETYLTGYKDGLKHLQSVLEDILEGTELSYGRSVQNEVRAELFRKRAIDQMARMNDEILRRYDVKRRTGNGLMN